MDLLAAQRHDIVEFGRRMVADGLVVGTSGNLSARVGDLIAVTPSGVPYDAVTAASVAVCRRDGTVVDGVSPPTSELPMHIAAYALTDAVAVVHTHSPAATAVSTLVDELPSLHYLVAMFGGPVRVAAYATYGTPELAENMAVAMSGRTGCLLGNHGALTVGGSLAEAYARAQYLEWLCDVWLRASAAGSPRLLPAAEIALVAEKLRSYGFRAATPDPA